MTMRPGLAKLCIPEPKGLLERRRLFARLDLAVKTGAAWVNGEAGIGKTSLVAGYLIARKCRTIWYRIDEADVDLGTFFHFLGVGAAAHLGTGASAAPFDPEYQHDPRAFTRRFVRELFARLRRSLVLVLDDVHRVGPDSALLPCIGTMLEEMPAALRLIAISREGPPIGLTRLLAHRDLVHIDASELRLTLDESRRLLASLGLTDVREAEHIHHMVDGWTAGLMMLCDRALHAPEAARAEHAHPGEATFNYFAAEIFDRIDEGMREFLLLTSLFPQFSEETARGITGHPEAPALLERALRKSLFVTRVQGDPPRYEYHPLFRNFLLETLARAQGPYRLAELRSRAAHLLRQGGLVEDAALLYSAAAQWSSLESLVAAEGERLLSQGRVQTLRDWVRQVPDAFLAGSAVLLYWLGISQQATAPADARGHFEQAYSRYERAGDRVGALEAAAAAAECVILEWSNMHDLDRWLPAFEAAARRYPAFPSLGAELRVLPGMLAAFVYRSSQHPACAQLMARAEQLMHDHPGLDHRMLLGAVAYLRSWLGDLERMNVAVQHMRALALGPQASPLVQIWWLCANAYFETLQERFGPALDAVSSAEAIAEREGLRSMDATIALRGALAAIGAGDAARAVVFCERAARLVNPRRHLETCTYLRLQGWLHVLRGESARGIVVLRQALEATERCGMEVMLISARRSLAMALVEAGQFAEARSLIESSAALPLALASSLTQYWYAVALAHLAQRQGDTASLVRFLGQALAHYRERSMGIPFTWHPGIMAALCAAALELGVEAQAAGALVRTHGLRCPPGAAGHWPWPVRLQCLGGFEIAIDNEPRRTAGKVSRKPIELLQLLVAHGARGAQATVLADAMWPEAEGDAAANALNQVVHRLRGLLRNDAAVLFADGRMSLDASICRIDAWAFDEAMAAVDASAEGLSAARLQRLGDDLLSLYRGPFLPDIDLPLVARERGRLQARFLRCVGTVGMALEAAERWDAAGALYERALEPDSLAESLYRRLMHCHAQAGRPAEALAVYQRCRRALATLAAIQPSGETEALARSLCSGGSASVRDS